MEEDDPSDYHHGRRWRVNNDPATIYHRVARRLFVVVIERRENAREIDDFLESWEHI